MSKEIKKKSPKPSIKDLTLIELAPYLTGKSTLPIEYDKAKITTKDFQAFWDIITMYDTYNIILNQMDYYEDFFNVCYDLKELFDPALHQELFYAAKVGYMYEGVPTYLVYMIKKCLEEYPFGNLIVKMFPIPLLNSYCKEGAINNTSIHDIIATELGVDYRVLDENNLISRYDKFSEVYIKNEDMVAIVPNDIVSVLTDDYISSK